MLIRSPDDGPGLYDILPFRSPKLYDSYAAFEYAVRTDGERTAAQPVRLMSPAQFSHWVLSMSTDEMRQHLHKWSLTPEQWFEELQSA